MSIELIIEDQKQIIYRLQQECAEKTNMIEILSNKTKELQNKLNQYEDYGGILDEGRAWASEAMQSREKFKQVNTSLKNLSSKLNTLSTLIDKDTLPQSIIKDCQSLIEDLTSLKDMATQFDL